jgi:deazaflavin-dependent oxidoreductase (nitroreductase family)
LGSRLEHPVLLLNTVGRKSGRERSVALDYFTDGETPFVIASNAGEPGNPAWWLNLREHPHATVQLGPERFSVVAREAQGAERERLWARAVDTDDAYATYQQRTSRLIPVVVLESTETVAR